MFPARLYKDKGYKLIVYVGIRNTFDSYTHFEGAACIRKEVQHIQSNLNKRHAFAEAFRSYIHNFTRPERMKKAAKQGLKPIEAGVVAGVGAVLMTNSYQYNVTSMNILIEVNPQVMDPKYAELAITGLNKILGIEVDLKDLDAGGKGGRVKDKGHAQEDEGEPRTLRQVR